MKRQKQSFEGRRSIRTWEVTNRSKTDKPEISPSTCYWSPTSKQCEAWAIDRTTIDRSAGINSEQCGRKYRYPWNVRRSTISNLLVDAYFPVRSYTSRYDVSLRHFSRRRIAHTQAMSLEISQARSWLERRKLEPHLTVTRRRLLRTSWASASIVPRAIAR